MIDTSEYENMTWETPSEAMRLAMLLYSHERFPTELEDAVQNLLAEVKRMQYWDEEMDRVIAHLGKHNWASSDGDVHEIVEYLLTEVKRLRSLAENLYDFYVGTYDGSLHLFEQQMDWREEE